VDAEGDPDTVVQSERGRDAGNVGLGTLGYSPPGEETGYRAAALRAGSDHCSVSLTGKKSSYVGSALPSDFKTFLNAYGCGAISGELVVVPRMDQAVAGAHA
jgi:hypothetical protein